MMKKIMGIFLVIITTVSLVGCSKNNDNKKSSNVINNTKVIKIGYPGTQNFLDGIAGIAQDKGYLDEELSKVGYIVEYKPFAAAGPAINEALVANQIDIAIYADFPGILSKSKGVDTSVIGITDNSINSSIIVKADSTIKSVKDLVGKKVGFVKGTYMQKYLYEILAKNGVQQSMVELINTTTGAESALLGGSIDAAIVTDNQAGLLVFKQGVAKFIDRSKEHDEPLAQAIIVSNNKFLSQNEDSVVAFFKALNRAKTFAVENSEEAYQILTKTGLSIDIVKDIYGKDNNSFNYASLQVDEVSENKLKSSMKFMLDNKLITKDFDINLWINNSYYNKSLKN